MTNFPANILPRINKAEKIDDVLEPFHNFINANLNCAKVGIIQSFNPATQRAVVQLVNLLRKNTYQGQQTIKIAPLIDCPVFIPYGLKGGLTFPIEAGLECLVIFSDKDIENWKVNGAIDKPFTYRMHDIADGLCLVGVRSEPRAIDDYNNDVVSLKYIEGAEVNLDSKIEVKNSEQNLKDLIANLISILQNLKTIDPVSGELPIDATTSSNLTTLLTNFNALLK